MKKTFRTAHILFVAAMFIAACSSPSTEKTVKENADSSVAEKTPAKTALAFKDAGLGNAWKNYDNLREALVKGDAATVQTEAGFLAEALIDVKESSAAAKQA
ncbi:MAG: hypothetical protein INR69_21255, partial [Mucilaginibacter polytrichastri]|nr:hypothetical protein [Mucilaginibacter polytrichastri]